MTLHARLVLEDCRAALAELTDDLSYDVWRRRWFTVIAMLVTTRDVVKRVDADADPDVKRANDKVFLELQQRPMWRDFIAGKGKAYGYRDELVHRYQLGVSRSVTIGVPSNLVDPVTGVNFHTMLGGSQAGRPCKEVAADLLACLDWYVDEVERWSQPTSVKGT